MQRSPELAPLSRDHNHALLLARRARQAAGRASEQEIAECWHALRSAWNLDLADHFAAEEKLLFPHLREHGEAELAASLQREHDAIRRTMTRADSLDATRLRVLGDVLEHHVRVEEREAFPLLERILTVSELAAIAAELEPEVNQREAASRAL